MSENPKLPLGRGWGPHQEGDRDLSEVPPATVGEIRKAFTVIPLLAGDELLAWDIYFAGVATIQYHPANPPGQRLTLSDMASIADRMLLMRRERCRSQ